MATTSDTRLVRNSECSMWRECRLKWYLSYVEGFLSTRVNPKFWLGTLVHFALSAHALGLTDRPEHLFWWMGSESIDEERDRAIAIEGFDMDIENVAELEKALWMGVAMIEGYVEWAATHHTDFDVLDSELSFFIPMEDLEGRAFTFVSKLDLLTEDSEGIRVQDYKTAADFRAESTIHMDQQFRRYPWVIRKAYPEWASEVIGSAWVALRKIRPSGRSKPPYFKYLPIDVAEREYEGIERELVAEVTAMLDAHEKVDAGADPREVIYPSPSMDCSWRCDYFINGMCQAWRSEVDYRDVGELHGSFDNDPYAEYKAEADASVATLGRREGGE